jgi:single-strand DNA-binding protein
MLNKVMLIGHLGGDPETLRTKASGRDYATLSIATSRRWRDRDSGERHEQTQWHRVVVWGDDPVALCRRLRKGARVWIEGELQHRTYTDRNGVERTIAEVAVSGFGGRLLELEKTSVPPVPEEPAGFSPDDYRAAHDGGNHRDYQRPL